VKILENQTKLVFKMNRRLFSLKPMLYITYLSMQIIWALSPFFTSYLISLMFDKLQVFQMSNYYILTSILLLINVVSIYIIRKAGLVDVLITFSVGKKIKNNLVMLLIDKKEIQTINTGVFLDIINYDIQTMEYMLLTQLDLVSQCFCVLVSLVIMWHINTIITVCIIIPFVIFSIVFWKICNIYKKKYSTSRESSINYSKILSELVLNRESAQFLGEKKNIISIFKEACDERGITRLKRAIYDIIMSSTTEFINYMGITLILISFIILKRNNNLTVGQLVLFISFIGYGCSYLQLFNSAANGIRSGEDSLGRIVKLIDGDMSESMEQLTEKTPHKEQREESNQLKSITFRDFRMEPEDSFHTFTLKTGDVVAVVGGNGSGKTRLFSALMGYTSYEGKIIIENIDNIKIGYVSQDIKLFDATIDENISILSEMDPYRISHFEKMANIDEQFKGRDINIGVNGKELSEGQRQRVAIARALYNNDGLIVLDDAFAYLDKDNRKKIFDNITALENIVIYATSDESLINKSNKIIRLDNSKLTFYVKEANHL
jgi:ABC-type bacteriocin/lantibiotic exporter with double-glycine peptidase domain